MTKTALRALTVAALSAVVTLTTAQAAQADPSCGFADPSVPGGWVATDCYPSDPEGQGPDQVQEQLPSERLGSARCEDPAQVIVSIDPDVCGYPTGPKVGAVEEEPAPAALAPATPTLAQQAPRASGGATPTLAAERPAPSTPVDTAPVAPSVDVTPQLDTAVQVTALAIDWAQIRAWLATAVRVVLA